MRVCSLRTFAEIDARNPVPHMILSSTLDATESSALRRHDNDIVLTYTRLVFPQKGEDNAIANYGMQVFSRCRSRFVPAKKPQ